MQRMSEQNDGSSCVLPLRSVRAVAVVVEYERSNMDSQ